MHIQWLAISSLPPLEHIQIECHEQVNLFIGPNACGKTTILRAVRGLHSLEPGPLDEFESSVSYSANLSDAPIWPYDQPASCSIDAISDRPRGPSDSTPSLRDAVPFLYIPATRINLPVQKISDQTIDQEGVDASDAPLKDLFDTESGIFDGHYVEQTIEWLRQGFIRHRRLQEGLNMAIAAGYACAKSICPEVLYDDVPHSFVEFDGRHERSESKRNVHYAMGIGTSDNILGEPIYAGALSSGTQGTLLWVWALALQMLNHYGGTAGWQQKPAILLIDEIENHLHPTWQRRVIPALLEHFPGLQIFATTHSPFVVAGLKAGQVHLLKRDQEGRVTASTNHEDVIGWTADEILRNMMGVDDPTDDVTAAAARELRELRNSALGDTAEAEDKRQRRMQELRQKVNRDLLAGGPMAAQRELFEEHLTEILEEHRRSESLNQDGG